MREEVKMNILFYIKKSKLLKTNEAPLFVRITINGERAEVGLKKAVIPKYWDDKYQFAKPKAQNHIEINELVEKSKKRLESIFNYLLFEETEVTSRLVIDKFLGKKFEAQKTILEIFKEHNENAHKLIGIDFSANTVERYETSFMHTKDFIKWQYKKADVKLDDVNQHFVKQYELYLKTVRKCAHNTTIKYLKNFKKIVRIALANNWMKADPFATTKFKLKTVDAVYLTSEELKLFQTKELSIERISQVRDMFLFCCYTGLAFSDVKTLKKEHLSIDKKGITWIHKKRVKTNQVCTIFLIEAAKKIIEKYKDEPQIVESDFVLPVSSNQKMNAYLKEIADICGIKKNISTHTARHTFATTVALENNIPMEVVSKIIGHSNIRMTHRYARPTEALIANSMKNIESIYC